MTKSELGTDIGTNFEPHSPNRQPLEAEPHAPPLAAALDYLSVASQITTQITQGQGDPRRRDLVVASDGTATLVDGSDVVWWGGEPYGIHDLAAYSHQGSGRQQGASAPSHGDPLWMMADDPGPLWDAGTSKVEIVNASPAIVTHLIGAAMPRRAPRALAATQYAMREGWRRMDFSSAFRCDLIAWREGESTIYDRYDFGNLMWGAAMYALGLPLWFSRAGAHYNSLKRHREPDTRADQRAIVRGYDWARAQSLRISVWPPDGHGENPF